MSERATDRYGGGLLLILGAGLWFYASFTIEANQGLTGLGPAFFPKFLSICLALLAGGLIVKSFLGPDHEAGGTEPDGVAAGSGRPWAGVLVFGIAAAYTFLVGLVGFIPATIVCMAAIMWILSVRRWYLFAGMVAFVVAIQYVFETLIYVQLP